MSSNTHDPKLAAFHDPADAAAADDDDDDDDDDDEPNADHVRCKFCNLAVYWADHYGTRGGRTRKLFDAARKRLHVCTGTQPNVNAFPKA